MDKKLAYDSIKDEDLIRLSEILQINTDEIKIIIAMTNLAKSNAYCPYSNFRGGLLLYIKRRIYTWLQCRKYILWN